MGTLNKSLIAVTTASLLSACGGGGSGGGSETRIEPVVTEPKEATHWVFHKHNYSSRHTNTTRPSTHMYDVAVLDVNDDGYQDIVFGGPRWSNGGWESEPIPHSVLINNQQYAMENNPELMFGDGNAIPEQVHTRAIGQADFDMNGLDDLIMFGHGYDSDPFPGEPLQLIMNEGKYWIDKSFNLNHDILGFYHAGTVVDANGDGYPDILAAGLANVYAEGEVAGNSVLLINNGNGAFSSGRNYLTDLHDEHWALTIVAGHLNTDSCEDILYTGFQNFVSWNKCFDNGFTNYNESTKLPGLGDEWTFATDATIADINNDGHSDILLGWTNNYEYRAVQVLINDGYGEFEDQTKEFIMSSFEGEDEWISRIYVEDLDLDGDKDIIMCIGDQWNIATTILENIDGAYTSVKDDIPSTVFPFDADNDGDLDLLSVDRTRGYTILENLTVK